MRLAAAFLALATLAAAVPAAAQQSITGRWLTEDRRAVIRIAPCGGNVCGYIDRVLEEMPDREAQRDENNPDPALRNRRIIGLPVLTGFRLDGNRWRHGHIYDPEDGRSYNARLQLRDGRLRVTGCVLGGIICQSQVWTRR